MSTQVSLRLNTSLVHQLDDLVRSGDARSRAEIVESALERELRRRLYAREVAILTASGAEPDDLHGLAEWAVSNHPALD